MNNNFWENKKVLVTGASGFIGSHFVEELANNKSFVKAIYQLKNKNIQYLEEKYTNVDCIKCNLLKFESIKTASQNVDIIINCAALDGNAEFKKQNAARILDTNNRISSNILNASVENDIKQTVLLSSAEIYPLNAKNPIKENDDYIKNFDNTQNGYVLSKRYSEILGELYAKQYGIKVFLPRLTNVYGPRDKFDESSNRVIPSMIKKILNNETIEIWGDGKQVRQFIYVKDAVSAILSILENNNEDDRIINISTDESISIIDLAKKMLTITDSQTKIKLLPNKTQGILMRTLDIHKLKNIFKSPFHTIEEGLQETINSYKENL